MDTTLSTMTRTLYHKKAVIGEGGLACRNQGGAGRDPINQPNGRPGDPGRAVGPTRPTLPAATISHSSCSVLGIELCTTHSSSVWPHSFLPPYFYSLSLVAHAAVLQQAGVVPRVDPAVPG